MSTLQIARAKEFLRMHQGPGLLLLPNAWDAVSAKLYEVEGFRAVATTSAGIASTLGFADGERMSLDDNLAVCRRIVERVAVPVSVDIEAGHSQCLAGLSETIARVIATGAVGINIEDSAKAGCGGTGCGGLLPCSAQAERIAAVREAADRAGLPLVINARTDVLLEHVDVTEERLNEAIERASAYRKAGADCIFVPDMNALTASDIAVLTGRIDAPLNLIAGDRTPGVKQLEELGVARLSFGPRPMRAALGFLRTMAREWQTAGTYTQVSSSSAPSYDEVNAWFSGDDRP